MNDDELPNVSGYATITADRYGGCYSGGKWLAFNCPPAEVPRGPFDDDCACADFWGGEVIDCGYIVGRGETPTAALVDLNNRLQDIGALTLGQQ